MLFVKCVACGSNNGLDGQFCRHCGKALSETELLQARNDMEALVLDGHRMLAQGRVAEAMMVAGTSLESNPSCKSALALYGDVLQKQGRISEAVDSYAQLIEIDPDYPGAAYRLDELKAEADSAKSITKRFRPTWTQIGYGVGAAVMLTAIGWAVLATTPHQDPAATNIAKLDPGVRTTWTGPAPVPAPPITNSPQASRVPNDQADTNPQAPVSTNPGQVPQVPTVVPGRAVGSIRTIGEPEKYNNLAPTGPKSSSTPTPSSKANATPVTSPTSTGSSTQPTSTGGSLPPSGAANTDSAPAPESVPVVEFSVSKSGAAPVSHSNEDNSAPRIEALIRVARERYAQADYEGAASAYEKAIKAGASKGSSNQRLAQCYEKLDRKSDAISAYQKAINAYEAQQNSKPEPRIERAIAACQKAIDVLKSE